MRHRACVYLLDGNARNALDMLMVMYVGVEIRDTKKSKWRRQEILMANCLGIMGGEKLPKCLCASCKYYRMCTLSDEYKENKVLFNPTLIIKVSETPDVFSGNYYYNLFCNEGDDTLGL